MDVSLNFEGHEASVTHLELVNRKYLASASKDKTIRMWETKTGVCLWSLEGHSRSIT